MPRLQVNASIVRDLAQGCAQYCPKAFILVISNPVNSTVPIVCEVLKQAKVFDPRRITVVGGHSGATIVPILSHVKQVALTSEEIKTLTHRIQYGGDEVVKAKDGAGSATLSMAHAGARFTNSLLEASVRGRSGHIESTYVHLPGNPGAEANIAATGLEYFSQDVELGPQGVARVLPLPTMSSEEQELVKIAIQELKGNISKGVAFIQNVPAKL
ncbi:hypothetical protein BGZ94_001624 [Podila epigama]|nr:hypothetical protein BGZ94_001624 [Podila epigama]